MGELNWLDFCVPCKNWCCRGENPFVSADEAVQLDLEKIGAKNDGSCVLLDDSGKCKRYENRPFECRIFPLDVREIEKELYWIVWDVCPAVSNLNCEERVDFFEKTFSKDWNLDYIRDYVSYHKSNQPEKYSKEKFRVIRKLNWPESGFL